MIPYVTHSKCWNAKKKKKKHLIVWKIMINVVITVSLYNGMRISKLGLPASPHTELSSALTDHEYQACPF